MSFSVSVEGLDKVISDFSVAGATASARSGEVVEDTAHKVEETAKQSAPRQTGALAASIQADVDGTTAEVGASIRYAGYVEYGTYKDAPQPYMGPAADQHEGEFLEEMGRVVGDI